MARGAIVVLASPTTKAPGGGDGVVLVALPAQEAIEAAGASLSQAAALRELENGAGSQFDPSCVEALVSLVDPNRTLLS